MKPHHSNPLVHAVLAAAVVIAVLLVLIGALLSFARTRPPHDELLGARARMTRRQRKAIMRDRLDLNPALRRDGSRLWRIP